MQKDSKSAYLTIIRLLAIYWVVLIQHNFAPFSCAWSWIGDGAFYSPFDKLTPYTSFITQLTMPACFCISGFLLDRTHGLHRDAFLKFLQQKVSRIYLPCIVFGALFMLIKENTIGVEVLYGYQHMWFIFYLFLMYLTKWF